MARTGGSKKNEPFAVRSAASPAGLMKLKPKAKTKSTLKPLSLSDPDIHDASGNPASLDTETSQDEGEESSVASPPEVIAPLRNPRGPPADLAGFNTVGDKDEILDVFSHKLPDPVWLRSNMGKQNGELKFIQHPNRDVSAHSWSEEQFEWVELGRYSCVRKTIDGKVTTPQFLQHIRAFKGRQPSLAYFSELAKEYPRYCELRPAVIMPPLSSMHPTNIVQQRPAPPAKPVAPTTTRYDSLPTISTTPQENDFPALSSLTLRDRSAATPRQPFAAARPSNTPQGLGAPDDDPFAADSPISPSTETSFAKSSEPFGKHMAERDPGKLNLDFRFPLGTGLNPRFENSSDIGEKDRRAFFADQERTRAEKMRQSFVPPDQSNLGSERPAKMDDTSLSVMMSMVPRFNALRNASAPVSQPGTMNTTGSASGASATPTAKLPSASFQPRQDQSMQQPSESRARMLEYLTRVGNEHPASHDPPKDQRGLQPPEPTSRTMANAGQVVVVYDKPTSSGSQVSRSALRTSDPEPGYYENRHANIYNSMDMVGPTAQNFNGPFFQDDVPTQANPTAHRSTRKSRGEDLDEWWKSGTLPERHDAFMKSLVGPKSSGGGNDDKDYMVTDRILVPLYETLASYVRLPGEPPKVPDHFARFAPPPEWAIDRSRDGDKSFFGEDWGETPRRIGRDPRFQPTFGQPRYTLFEDPREEPAMRFPPEMRSNQSGSNYGNGSTHHGGSNYPSGSNHSSGYFMPSKY